MSKLFSLLKTIPNKLTNSNAANNSLLLTINNYCTAVKCWKCGVEKKSAFEIFCEKCSVIQEPHAKENYFKLIGIDENYDVDMKLLTGKYRKLQSILHPDKYSNKSDEEKLISEEYSSMLNRAYNTLQSPINRGLYLLSLRGKQINEQDNESKDQKFLMEIMELNEEIEAANKPEQLKQLNNKNRETLNKLSEQLSRAFKSGDLTTAKNVLIKMKYYTSISLQVNNILRERGIVD